MGKRKIWKVLVRNKDMIISKSTVRRILSKLIRKSHVKSAPFYRGQVKPKRPSIFTHHANRWKRSMKAKRIGELIQIDYMSVSLIAEYAVKEFSATARGLVVQAYSNVTRRNAKDLCNV